MRHARTIAVLLALLGCSEEFNPVAEGGRPYVVFALLNSASDVQIIRVHETAPPTDEHPGSPPVPGAIVRLTGPGGTVTLRDTILYPPPGLGDTAGVNAYVIDPLTPVRDATYILDVSSPRGDAHATMIVPGPGALSTSDFLILQTPNAYPTQDLIAIRALLSQHALGYVVRLLIEYERLIDGVWTTELTEVPTAYTDTHVPEYPNLTRRVSTTGRSISGRPNTETAYFRNSEYRQTLSLLYRRFGPDDLRMKRAVIVLTQADVHFFTYYSFANFFQDPLTIRVDQPDYSNMTGALGFFGSMTTDTISFTLPQDLSPPSVPTSP